MKPILHIKLPEVPQYENILVIYNEAKQHTNNEYHVLISHGVEMQVLNGEQLTELTFEQFKQQYTK